MEWDDIFVWGNIKTNDISWSHLFSDSEREKQRPHAVDHGRNKYIHVCVSLQNIPTFIEL